MLISKLLHSSSPPPFLRFLYQFLDFLLSLSSDMGALTFSRMSPIWALMILRLHDGRESFCVIIPFSPLSLVRFSPETIVYSGSVALLAYLFGVPGSWDLIPAFSLHLKIRGGRTMSMIVCLLWWRSLTEDGGALNVARRGGCRTLAYLSGVFSIDFATEQSIEYYGSANIPPFSRLFKRVMAVNISYYLAGHPHVRRYPLLLVLFVPSP